MTWNAQVATSTLNNRYPGIFRTVQGRIAQKFGADLGGNRLKILSFGCSDGSEISSLRSYFPEALIFGCDVNEEALGAASEALFMDEAFLFRSSSEAILRYGPFDVVFAMSVLCRFPDSMKADLIDFTPVYSHDSFNRGIQLLSDALRDDGILCLYNTNYSFLQLDLANGFRVVSSPLIGSNGFVDHFDNRGARVTWCEKVGPYFVHRVRSKSAEVDQHDFSNCVFEKCGVAGAKRLIVPVVPSANLSADAAPEAFKFGPDLAQCAQDGLIATALGYFFGDEAAGQPLVRAWFQTTPSGGMKRGPAWASSSIDSARFALLADTRNEFRAIRRQGHLRGAISALKSGGRQLRRHLVGRANRLSSAVHRSSWP
jgi:SAM-dependent methyltransferase